jgi:FixJ family two-component response regulator
VHVVDDDDSFRTAIARLLRASGYEVATYVTAQQLLDSPPEDTVPGCILLDVQIPEVSGPELQLRLAQIGSTVPIVFLTGHGDITTGVQAIKAGADDFLTKPVAADRLLSAVESAVARHEATRDRRDRLRRLRSLAAELTPRERSVLELVVLGRMNKQIAHDLGTSERTIKAHRRQVMFKMGVKTLAELVSIAEHIGIVRDPAALK